MSKQNSVSVNNMFMAFRQSGKHPLLPVSLILILFSTVYKMVLNPMTSWWLPLLVFLFLLIGIGLVYIGSHLSRGGMCLCGLKVLRVFSVLFLLWSAICACIVPFAMWIDQDAVFKFSIWLTDTLQMGKEMAFFHIAYNLDYAFFGALDAITDIMRLLAAIFFMKTVWGLIHGFKINEPQKCKGGIGFAIAWILLFVPEMFNKISLFISMEGWRFLDVKMVVLSAIYLLEMIIPAIYVCLVCRNLKK